MALRAGYKGFKKLLGLKMIRPGTLAVDNAVLSKTFFPRSEQAVLGAKNLWEVKLSELKALNQAGTWTGNTYVKQGITYTFTTIGDYVTEIILNGTASQDWVTFAIPAKTIKAGSYILSGSNGGEVASYRITASATGVSDIINYDGDTAFSLSADTSLSANVTIRTKDYVANNVVFKLMIRLSTDPDDTYAPYAMTNEQLTDNKYGLNKVLDTTDDLDNVKEKGIYIIKGNPINAPENASYATMIVSPIYGDGSLPTIQTIFMGNNIYSRTYSGSPIKWNSWYKYTGTVVS